MTRDQKAAKFKSMREQGYHPIARAKGIVDICNCEEELSTDFIFYYFLFGEYITKEEQAD